MAEPRVVDEWIKKAEEDYQFASSVLEDSTFYAQICFHFHQAAEKYLKAFVVARDLEFQKIHGNKSKPNSLEGRNGSTIFQYH
jgi:HEPN domain-containing protein